MIRSGSRSFPTIRRVCPERLRVRTIFRRNPSCARLGATKAPAPLVFCRHQRSELLQSFVDAEDAFRGGIRVEKPVFATFGSCSPKHAPRCRYIKIQREAVANHRNVWQSTNQFAPIDSAASVFQIIRVEWRGRLGNALAVIRARYRG